MGVLYQAAVGGDIEKIQSYFRTRDEKLKRIRTYQEKYRKLTDELNEI